MPSIHRRTVLATVGTALAGSIAGCSALDGTSENPPAGSLLFANEDDVPHSITMWVTDTGTGVGDDPYTVTGRTTAPPSQQTLSASTVLDPGDVETYESVFTEPVWYAVRFTADDRVPENDAGRVVFTPVPEGRTSGRTLTGRMGTEGEFSWTVSSTTDLGRFES